MIFCSPLTYTSNKILLLTKRYKVTREWRKLHNEELNDTYSSPNIVRVSKSRMRWTGHVAHMGGEERCIQGLWRNLRERGPLEDRCLDGRIILRWILRKGDGRAWTGLIWLRIGTDGGLL
jgi:hypothetical protein